MKILFYHPFAINTPHYETALELIEDQIDMGNEVTLLGCDASLFRCAANIYGSKFMCMNCVAHRKKGLRYLGKDIDYLSLSEIEVDTSTFKIPDKIASVEQVKSIYYQNMDLGEAALSTVVSSFHNSNIDFDKYQTFFKDLLESTLRVYLVALKLLQTNEFEQVYFFNGRYASQRAFLRACEYCNIPFTVYERGFKKDMYMLYENHMPHNIKGREKLIKDHWDALEESPEERESIAREFFTNRMSGIIPNWNSFLEKQKKGILPKGWDEKKTNIAVFLSSDHEFLAIGEDWKNKIYANQKDGVVKILNSFSNNKDYYFYVRMHPNQAGTNYKEWTESIPSMANCSLVHPEDEVDTYSLMYASDKVLTFGSTMGLEASYHGKVSVLAGSCFYQSLGSVYVPRDHVEVVRLLQDDSLRPLPIEGALKFGNYQNSFGFKYKYYKYESLISGLYKAKRIQGNIVQRILLFLARVRIYLLKKKYRTFN